MHSAQGALEYLIIIAAVLGITAVVVLFIAGAFTGSSAGADLSKCRLAAANCGKNLALGVSANCSYCKEACIDSVTGLELSPGVIASCMAGGISAISANANLTVALVNHSSCTCRWTVGTNCAAWWKEKLVQRGFNVQSIDISTIQDLNEMKKYKAILNPYGETYLTDGVNHLAAIGNIREYVSQGGYWFEYGGYPLYYTCSGTDIGYIGSRNACISIGGPLVADVRNITAYGKSVAPTAPSAITGDRRPSVGNDFTTIAACNPMASGATYNPMYLNSSNPYSGPTAHCYGLGCIVRSDVFLPTSNEDIVTIYTEFMRTKVF